MTAQPTPETDEIEGEEEATDDPNAANADAVSSETMSPDRGTWSSRRQDRLDAAERAAWQATKKNILAVIADLRADDEGTLLQSPQLVAAQLYGAPDRRSVPDPPEGPEPAPTDKSERAAAWRRQMRQHVYYRDWRRREKQAHTLKPYHTWPQHPSLGERGGKRPGQSAYTAQIGRYLAHRDEQGADGWGSSIGMAYRRLEDKHSDELMCRAVRLWTDPVWQGKPQWRVIAPRLGIGKTCLYAWLDAGVAWVDAEATDLLHGAQASATRAARAQAQRIEAQAWRAS